ncbi:putative sam domain [Phaeomoniella chlamydospora]|uniref:Putative sam domain n=1 Tax=Phaeomoniella chlamydospora TaxID=158046 RepID=A0A0G2GQU0_PHACM|nr:putative sam domain [Phaeomoniella chlamydospora]
MDYRYDNGRRYHAYEQEKYRLPNDEREADRLVDLQHQISLLANDGKLFSAPIEEDKITHALDIGTGTGLWAIEFADQHPSCSVIGTDLSPIQPTWVPPNCSFLVDDCEATDNDWIFPPMDFIHSRFIIGGIKNWPALFKRAYNALKPGGWIEVHEPNLPIRCDDGTADSSHPMIQWSQHCRDACAKTGVDTTASERFVQQLSDAGFINIVRQDHRWPIGAWSSNERDRLIGEYQIPNMTEAVNTTVAYFRRVLGWSEEEFEVFLAKCRTANKDLNMHVYFPV